MLKRFVLTKPGAWRKALDLEGHPREAFPRSLPRFEASLVKPGARESSAQVSAAAEPAKVGISAIAARARRDPSDTQTAFFGVKSVA